MSKLDEKWKVGDWFEFDGPNGPLIEKIADISGHDIQGHKGTIISEWFCRPIPTPDQDEPFWNFVESSADDVPLDYRSKALMWLKERYEELQKRVEELEANRVKAG